MALLAVRDVTVRYGGLVAASHVTLEASEAAVTGLIGPNGAGKSTLLGVASGLVVPNSGTVEFDGRVITKLAPHQRTRLGMSRTFQRLDLWESMTVRGNVQTAAEFAARWTPGLDPRQTAEELIEAFNLTRVADQQARSLPSGLARLVEVARALASRPRLVLLDEPSAGLDDRESHQLGETLVSVAARGTAILLVEHHVEMVLGTCTQVWVMDFGQVIAGGPPSAIRSDSRVQAAYLGRPA